MRVLLIDDDPLLLDSLAALLQPHYDVVTAVGGECGLATFCQALVDGSPFGVVVTDLGMPRMDGYEFIQRIRKIAPRTPTILLTGWGEQPGAVGAMAGRADRVVSKPVRIEELQEALGIVLRFN
jgi:DNA-binding response OmpR family regulator